MSEPEIGGWVCMDDDSEILGIGNTEEEAWHDAQDAIHLSLPDLLTKSGIELNLSYHRATKRAMDYIANFGGNVWAFKKLQWEGKPLIALKEEDILQRCPKTPDMFSTG